MSTSVAAQAEAFRALHHGDRPLQLVNVWDAWSARVAVAAGATAIGTSSFAVAMQHGVLDGEVLPFEAAVEGFAEIAAAVDVPLSVDLEAGRGSSPEAVAGSVAAALRCGAVGCNLEDAVPGQPGRLFSAAEQAARLAAARATADELGVPVFLNARCDVWFGAAVPAFDQRDEALRRAEAYAAAGADGLFLPGLVDLDLLAAVSAATPLAVNVMAQPGMPSVDDLAAAGVRRISQGGTSFLGVTGALAGAVQHYLAGELTPDLEQLGRALAVLPALTG
jgi:2-methylisocitrate lyase-like PEP mutase family enzyme